MTDRKEHPETLCQAPTGLDDFDNKNIEISSIDSWIIEDEGCISSDDNGAWSSKQQAEYDAYLAKNRKILSGKAIIKHEKGNTRPKLLVDRANPDKTIEAFASIIAESGSFYDHNNEIVEVTLDRNTGLDIIRKVDAGLLVIEAHRRTRPYLIKYDNGTFEEKDTQFTKEFAALYLSGRYYQSLPPLKAIISSPLLGPDGSINCANGYNKATGFYLSGVPDVGPMIPMNPMQADAENALKLLRSAFKTFAFADADTILDNNGTHIVDISQPPKADESACLVAILTAVVRPSLSLSPALLVRAAETSGAGSGKGKMVRCICAIAFSRQPSAITSGQNSDELEKRITSKLMSYPSCLLLDNMNGITLRSDLLASVLTENPAETRILGQSRTAYLSSTTLIAVTGNGVQVSEDLARRFIEVFFDAKVEDPESRVFEGDIIKEITERRTELLAACLTIWRWGMHTPLAKGKALGGFEQWCSWVRDPLLALGCLDPVLRVAVAKQSDPYRMRKAEIFQAWWDNHNSRPVKVTSICEAVRVLLDPQGRPRQYLARQVERLEGTRIAGFVMTKQKSSKWSGATYALQHSVEGPHVTPQRPVEGSPHEVTETTNPDCNYPSSSLGGEGHRDHRDHKEVEDIISPVAKPASCAEWYDL